MSAEYEIPRGPEDIPLKSYVKVFPVVIVIKDLKSGRLVREERINYSDPEARKWLGRTTHWACSNKYSIETCADADYKIPE